MNNKYLKLLRRVDAALHVLKGHEVYVKNKSFLLKTRELDGKFKSGDLPKVLPEWIYNLANSIEFTLEIARQKLIEMRDSK